MALGKHKIIVLLAFWSCGATLMAAIAEVRRHRAQFKLIAQGMRFGQEASGIQKRQRAFAEGTLTTYDAGFVVCPFYVPGTDVPEQPAAYGLTPGWHVWNMIVLAFLLPGEAPKSHFWLDRMDGWAGAIVGKTVGVWPTGAIQVLIALGMLRVSPGVMGNLRASIKLHLLTVAGTAWFRYLTGWILAGTGLLNIALGMAYGSKIRGMRGQIKDEKKDGGPSKKDKLVEAWVQLQAVLDTMQTSQSVGGYMATKQAVTDAIGKM